MCENNEMTVCEEKKSKNPFALPKSVLEWFLFVLTAICFVLYFSPAFKIELLGRVTKNLDYFLVNSLSNGGTSLIFIIGFSVCIVSLFTKLPSVAKAGLLLAMSLWSIFWFVVAYFACNDMYKKGGFSAVPTGWIFISLSVVAAALAAVYLIKSLLIKKPCSD